MKQITFLLLISICFLSCQAQEVKGKHVFYLHSRIIELQGVNAISEQFGKYEYRAIIDSLVSPETHVHHEVRTERTNFQNFCESISQEINELIEAGAKPSDITVIGASKGAVMAMNISNMNVTAINYVLLAANNDYIEIENQWNLHGNILGIYEKSDVLAGKDYEHWIKVSTNASSFEQLEINTGLGHGFLYRPLPEWLYPTKEWINSEK